MKSHFSSKRAKTTPSISTASLPDIVFILLFFFMVVTVMRTSTPKVKNDLPKATELDKLGRKSTLAYLYIGKPLVDYQGKQGASDKLQLDDAFADADDVGPWILEKITGMSEEDRPFLRVVIKEDVESKVGILTDVKQELRKVNALRVTYATLPRADEDL